MDKNALYFLLGLGILGLLSRYRGGVALPWETKTVIYTPPSGTGLGS